MKILRTIALLFLALPMAGCVVLDSEAYIERVDERVAFNAERAQYALDNPSFLIAARDLSRGGQLPLLANRISGRWGYYEYVCFTFSRGGYHMAGCMEEWEWLSMQRYTMIRMVLSRDIIADGQPVYFLAY